MLVSYGKEEQKKIMGKLHREDWVSKQAKKGKKKEKDENNNKTEHN